MKISYCRKCQIYTECQADGQCKPCAAERQKNHPERVAAEVVRRDEARRKAALKRRQRSDNRKAAAAKRAAYGQNRRARKLNAGGSHTAEDICAITTYQNNLCACCATSIKGGYHVDHIEALSKGGSNDRRNLQLLCEKCNTRKNAKHPIEFMKATFPEMVKSWAAALLNRREVIGF